MSVSTKEFFLDFRGGGGGGQVFSFMFKVGVTNLYQRVPIQNYRMITEGKKWNIIIEGNCKEFNLNIDFKEELL